MKRLWVLLLPAALLANLFALSCPAEPPKTVYLQPSANWMLRADEIPLVRVLIREIARQAFLLAARDEMGLATRDAWLGDAMPTGGDNAPWDIKGLPTDRFVLEAVRGFPPNVKSFAKHEFNLDDYPTYHSLLAMMENLSRTKFVEALKQAGYSSRPNHRDEKIAVANRVEKRLGEMEIVSQFQAIRELHAMLRTQGESQALLGALARGYANLGVLIEHCWHPAHKTMKARALLYAQRMCPRDEDSPWPRWHRAYVSALTGLHAAALFDLAQAETLWDAMPKAGRPAKPAWLPLIDALCRSDVKEISQRLDDPNVGQLAAMLKFEAVEMEGDSTWTVQTALEVLPKIPECYRVYDGLCEYAGVGTAHTATSKPIDVLGEKLYDRLMSLPGLPGEVREIAKERASGKGLLGALLGKPNASEGDDFPLRGAVIRALLATGEPSEPRPAADKADRDSVEGEPSWAALGLILREISFKQVFRRASFLRHQLSVPAEEWLAATKPLTEGHPARPFLDAMAWDAGAKKDAVARVGQMNFRGVEYPCELFGDVFYPDNKTRMTVYRTLMRNRDETAPEIISNVGSYWVKNKKPLIDCLLEVSPHSPRAQALLIEHHWDEIQDKVEEWDKQSAAHPAVSFALANRYSDLGRWDDAERCYRATIAVVPGSFASYNRLAELYQQQGKTDRWLETLEEFLKQPDYGLEHHQVQKNIARHFIQQKEWEKALPYARGAAESYSGWGLRVAAECYEGLHQWDKAEQHYRACSQRYENSSLDWYLFCRRTGEGDVESAREYARAYMAKYAGSIQKPNRFDVIAYHLLENQPEKALAEVEQALAEDPDSKNWNTCETALWAAFLADRLKDEKKRTIAMNRARSTVKRFDLRVKTVAAIALIELMTKDLAQGGLGRIDLAEADKLSDSLSTEDERLTFHFMLAQYLNQHGQPEAADRYAKRCMGWTWMTAPFRTLAGAMLVEHEVDPTADESPRSAESETQSKP